MSFRNPKRAVLGGEQAVSVGWARPIGSRGSISLGGAFSGSDSSAGIGFGLDL